MAKDGLTERIAARCTPKVKTAIKREMERTGLSEGQVLEGIILHHLTGDFEATALGLLVSRLAKELASQLWDDDLNDCWFDSPYKHSVISNSINRLLELLRPKGTPETPRQVLKALKFLNLDTLDDHTKAGNFAAGALAKNLIGVEENPKASRFELGHLKYMLKSETGGW